VRRSHERTRQAAERPKIASQDDLAACLEFGAFNPVTRRGVQQALEPLALGQALQRRAGPNRELLVFMPPQRNDRRQTRSDRAQEKLGVGRLLCRAESKFRFAISLGVFKPRRRRGRGSQKCAKRASNGRGRSKETSGRKFFLLFLRSRGAVSETERLTPELCGQRAEGLLAGGKTQRELIRRISSAGRSSSAGA